MGERQHQGNHPNDQAGDQSGDQATAIAFGPIDHTEGTGKQLKHA